MCWCFLMIITTRLKFRFPKSDKNFVSHIVEFIFYAYISFRKLHLSYFYSKIIYWTFEAVLHLKATSTDKELFKSLV